MNNLARADKFMDNKTNNQKHHNIDLKDLSIIDFGGSNIQYPISAFFNITAVDTKKTIQTIPVLSV
jgi:hypothetical protein